ncbi:NADH-quinone oxidoreductase subunit L [Gordonia hirsuta DSM 44140 = NBRC 16056]|uniref:NADH-quinone oxidoreductase subunit L n=1 Tax=Gordonia hirsuta DSM 44140 = NBRC 16056 TaxID=1121927 RepID=L7LC22_9ACTN|nr:NADH-quinone oxidoreductase subunit L [Gordonia hirsuta]GAC57622.1 NADH-quinone oxidoreductase subunit L [Gordonia hirsuta DSM 44140 = NBRC 16056]
MLWWLPGLPALGALLLLVGGRRTDRWGHLLATALAGASAVVAIVAAVAMIGRDTADRTVLAHGWRWITAGDFHVEAGLRLDQLSVCFVLLITVVGTLIHLYSIGYMAADPDRRRFFAYLNLFLAAMLVLVLADGYLGIYLGWEGVGLASYLLIGFWQHKPSAATAAKKAFIINRVGDVGFVIALMVMFATFGSVGFGPVFDGAAAAGEGTLNAICLLLLLAACAKSAQVPLQAWLLDAMEGPTPVSALIHAATMVTAGVYLITRSAPLYDLAPGAQTAVIVVGAVTLLFGAVIGCAKDDIKKALAASTMSQIGYMVLAAGLGPAGYAFAIAHLIAHGFFKAGLFLGAGSVMHAMDDETDMRRYGGLARVMPITFVTFGLGYLALIGIPPLSGFFTKDSIIEAALAAGGVRGPLLFVVAVTGAGLTAFYMTRVMVMTFFGQRRWEVPGRPAPQPREAPPTMTWPMIVLAVGSVGAGGALIIGGGLQHWLAPVVGQAEHRQAPLPAAAVTVLVLVSVLIGAGLAWRRYQLTPVAPEAPAQVSALTRAARRDLYGDAVNEGLFAAPGQLLTRALVTVEDDGMARIPAEVGAGVDRISRLSRGLQNGFVRSYAASILVGTLAIGVIVWVVSAL